MDIRKLQRAIVDGLEDVKGQNIVVFNTEHLSPLFERVIIASGTSNRQTKALAQSVRDAVKAGGMQALRTEGEDNGEWIIVDCGAAVVHLMQPSIRDYYHLEEIWGGKPVKMKLDLAPVRLVKAAEPEPEPKRATKPNAAANRLTALKEAPAKKGAAKKPASTAKAPTRKVAAAAPAPARKAAAKSAPAKAPTSRKAPPKRATVVVKSVVTRTVGVKSAAAKKTVTRTVAPKAVAAKKAPTGKAPAKKAPARKTASRS
jgi:ribosome-associated protein